MTLTPPPIPVILRIMRELLMSSGRITILTAAGGKRRAINGMLHTDTPGHIPRG